MNPAASHSVTSVERVNHGVRPATVEVHVASSDHARELRIRTSVAGFTNTTSNWTIEVDDARWRALVDLLLPPGEIADTPREDGAARPCPINTRGADPHE